MQVKYIVLILNKKGLIKTVAAVITAITIIIAIICCVPFGGKKLNFSATFYYVVYDSPPDAQSVASVSSLVRSYGGAGYIIEHDKKYFVTVSCYYDKADATSVCASLVNSGLNCSVTEASSQNLQLYGNAENYAEKYEGNLNTLLSLSKICYNLANSIDRREVDQSGAKTILNDVKRGLNGLKSQNVNNCFSTELDNLLCECDDVSYGYVFSYDVRRLQIAICDTILNVKLY